MNSTETKAVQINYVLLRTQTKKLFKVENDESVHLWNVKIFDLKLWNGQISQLQKFNGLELREVNGEAFSADENGLQNTFLKSEQILQITLRVTFEIPITTICSARL